MKSTFHGKVSHSILWPLPAYSCIWHCNDSNLLTHFCLHTWVPHLCVLPLPSLLSQCLWVATTRYVCFTEAKIWAFSLMRPANPKPAFSHTILGFVLGTAVGGQISKTLSPKSRSVFIFRSSVPLYLPSLLKDILYLESIWSFQELSATPFLRRQDQRGVL